MSSGALDVGVCIPVLDERASLGTLLDDLRAGLADASYTLCFVDDGSTDGTLELLAREAGADPRIVVLKRPRRPGGCLRGGASRAGHEWLLAHTSHLWIADFDADGSHRVDELALAVRRGEEVGADVVIASKYLATSRVLGRPWLRRLGSRAYNLMLRGLFHRGIRDYSNSFRVYRRAAARDLFEIEPSYESPVYLIEMMAAWLARGRVIAEIPTVYEERRGGESKVIVRDAVDGFVGAARVGLAYRAGRYGARRATSARGADVP